MKHTIINRIAALLLLAVGLAGCSKEETLPGTTRLPVSISVTDGGYAYASADGARTRAVENGYATTFTAGDQIGLYAVVGNTIVAQNVCLTAADNGTGGVSWTGNAYYEGVTAKYFAYYPYQSALNGTLAPSAADAAGFFADAVSAWALTTDQSTHAKYTAQDLMVGSGSISKQANGTLSLSFTMTHAMALVVIETPTTKYKFTNTTPSIPDYYIPAPNTTFYGFTPYSPSVGTYRYLVKPAQSAANDLTGSYTGATGNTKEYALTQNGLAAAKYAYYKVDRGIIAKTHTLQTCDFYMKDGSLLGKDETPTEGQKAACIGIVYWLGDPTNDDPLLKRDHPDCTHGLVVALHEAKNPSTNTAAKMKWSNSHEQVNDWTNSDNRGANKVDITKEDKMQGYANTVALTAYNTQQTNADLKVLPIAAIEQYHTDNPAPASSSGWYVPSIMELKYVCWGQGNSHGSIGRDLLNGQFAKAGGTSFDASWNYWSSSERAYYGNYAWHVDFNSGVVYNLGKDNREFWVRAIFAF